MNLSRAAELSSSVNRPSPLMAITATTISTRASPTAPTTAIRSR
jgi:hypothetical protein